MSDSTHIDIARVGPGSLGGRYLRQFWLPVYRGEDLTPGHAKPMKRLGENFSIFRGRSGKAQVLDYHCAYRRAPLHLGWVEGDAIRCMYHGWKYDCAGQCVDQPAEEDGFAE